MCGDMNLNFMISKHSGSGKYKYLRLGKPLVKRDGGLICLFQIVCSIEWYYDSYSAYSLLMTYGMEMQMALFV